MSIKKSLYKSFLFSVALISIAPGAPSTVAQDDGATKVKLTSEAKRAREQSLAMLDEMEDILKEHYYDPNFRGIDLKARIEAAKARVKTLQFNWQMFRVLVQVLMDFNDSHTRMILPPRSDHFQYGFGMQMVGDICYVTSVKKGSDAEKQGVAVGDEIVALGRFKPNRRDLWKMIYVLYKLDPGKTVDLKLRKPDGTERSLTVTARTMTEKEYKAELKARKDRAKFEPFKCQQISPDVIACKLYSFVVEKNDIDKMMSQARKFPKLILDLRGNSGGYVTIEEYLLSHFFEQPVKIADIITRKKTEQRMTRTLGDRVYKGEVAVLIDSNSASAAEITARVLQIEKRAGVYGDFSSGSVMTSVTLPFRKLMSALSDAAIIYAGMSVTVADVVMRDGSRLEHKGVQPDEVLQPTGLAFAQKTDALLAFVATKFGSPITFEQAGKYHFLLPKEESDGGDDDEAEAQ